VALLLYAVLYLVTGLLGAVNHAVQGFLFGGTFSAATVSLLLELCVVVLVGYT
jgi:hypothetical protein